MSEHNERMRWVVAAVALLAAANGLVGAEAPKVPQAVAALASVTHRAVPHASLFDVAPPPTLKDREEDPAYVPGVLVNGVMYPADVAASDEHGAGGHQMGFHNYLTTDPGTSLFCVDGICR